jgi:aldehyde dehydrogenase (NAD+)
LTVNNPANDSVISSDIHVAAEDDINEAVAAARHAFRKGPWSRFTGAQRAACMNKLADLLEQNTSDLARSETLAMGMPISVSKIFVSMAVQAFRCMVYSLGEGARTDSPLDYAGFADKLAGESFPADDGFYKIVRYEALGVCAGIASWNASFLYGPFSRDYPAKIHQRYSR